MAGTDISNQFAQAANVCFQDPKTGHMVMETSEGRPIAETLGVVGVKPGQDSVEVTAAAAIYPGGVVAAGKMFIDAKDGICSARTNSDFLGLNEKSAILLNGPLGQK